MKLDERQKEIVQAEEEKILVISGPGAGKTAVLTERVKYLLQTSKNDENIVAITFTNAAADEMKERIGQTSKKLFIGTIHSYANQLLRRAGIDTSKILDDEDFDELFELIQKYPQCLEPVTHLLVDEFQDINEQQYSFFDMVQPTNFFVVGDDNQCIYGFRGSNINFFFDMYDDPLTKVYYLENNYRSGYNILSFAAKFLRHLSHKIPKKIVPKIEDRGDVNTFGDNNFNFFINQILKEENYKDWFILTRTNAQVDEFILDLQRRSIPCDTFKKGDLNSGELEKKLKENTVKVLTAHSAKGLENENVVVYGLIPYNDDEARLCYVAATRAKHQLIWYFTIGRDKYKKKSRYSTRTWE